MNQLKPHGHDQLEWYFYLIYGGLSIFLIVFAGLMSGLTLGLLSIDKLTLNILKTTGTAKEKKYAKRISPILKNHHLLLVTLLLFNALSMEALPIFLDKLVPEVFAILLSVTAVLLFGEIIPQALCSRFGLAIGGNLAFLVKLLMVIGFPVAYPISKLLDCILGKNHLTFFRRAQLKELVSIHGQEEHGGYLTKDEILVIRGALELTEKTVEKIMTPISKVFMLDYDTRFDERMWSKVIDESHSRIPIYKNNDTNHIVGVLLLKDLMKHMMKFMKFPNVYYHNGSTRNGSFDELAVKNTLPTVSDLEIRAMPIVEKNTPLWDLLNEFQTGKSHMAVVIEKVSDESTPIINHKPQKNIQTTASYLRNNENDDLVAEEADDDSVNQNPEKRVIGIVTLEDILEEIIGEEIYDETDINSTAEKPIIRAVDLFRKLATGRRHPNHTAMIRQSSVHAIPVVNKKLRQIQSQYHSLSVSRFHSQRMSSPIDSPIPGDQYHSSQSFYENNDNEEGTSV